MMPRATEVGAVRVRIATYNVHGCVGTDGRYSPQRTLRVIAGLDADVLGLQEVDSREGRHADGFAALRDGTGFHAIPGPNLHQGRGTYGNLLLSRWPARTVRRVDLSVAGREPRGALDVVLETPAGALRVVLTHLGLRRRERRQQIAVLRAMLAGHTGGVAVALGDFNVPRWRGPDLFGYVARRLPAQPRTFPSRWPLLALDRIQASPPEALRWVRAHRGARVALASDHLPLTGELDLGHL